MPFNKMAGGRQWNGFGGSSVKYLHSLPEMAAEPPMTTIIGEGREAIRSGIERQIKARMIDDGRRTRSEKARGALVTPMEE